jgi:hypothetical protein
MRNILISLLAIALGAFAVVPPADAHGGRARVRFGVFVGGPWWWHGYAWPHPYYRQPIVIERRGPTVYVEKDPDGVQRAPDQYWYYCPDSDTYYPYVKECASPWHRVAPQPQD